MIDEKTRYRVKATVWLMGLSGALLFFAAGLSTFAADGRTFQANNGELLSGASKSAGQQAPDVAIVSLAKAGQGVKFTGLPAASTLAIHYGSISVGTISVSVNDQAHKR